MERHDEASPLNALSMGAASGLAHIRVGVGAAIVRDGRLLLVEYDTSAVDDGGIHFNLPGGGVEIGETLSEAVRREAREEADAEIVVGPLIHVFEYVPARCGGRYGPRQKLILVFRCKLVPGSEPRMPDAPDAHQTGVRWVPLDALGETALLPAPTPAFLRALRSDSLPTVACEEA